MIFLYGHNDKKLMTELRIYLLLIFFTSSFGCSEMETSSMGNRSPTEFTNDFDALLLTNYSSLDEFQEIVNIDYFKSKVVLTYSSKQGAIVSVLAAGVQEGDFTKARDGNFWDRAKLGMRTPYVVIHKADIISIEILGRRRHLMFGEGDVAFYDLAEQTVRQIREEDQLELSEKELSEKGFLNTFNHVTAQALITTIFSERMADYISDVHERETMPELISGHFTDAQRSDVDNGPTDNYVDMINNECGQALGKRLKAKYQIRSNTIWTPELLADYLNDTQNYYSKVFHINFIPFLETDELVIRFSNKINIVKEEVIELVNKYYKDKSVL